MQFKYKNYEDVISLKDFNEGKERIVFVMCPCWGVVLPPYGLSKLVGLVRQEGYACKVYDLNVQLYHYLLDKTSEDYWRSENFFYWTDSWFYENKLSELVNPILLKAVDNIVNDNPTIVGLSLFDTNNESSFFLIKELRKRLPEVKIIIGGPVITTNDNYVEKYLTDGSVDFIFKGESEETLIDYLENKKVTNKIIGEFSKNSRVNLSEIPFADYSDYDLTSYNKTNGASLETSRGCIAKCVFCTETNFWKYRSVDPHRIVDEMSFQFEKYNITHFWVIDSLVNGDLKKLREFVNILINSKINITWNSYARCDGRMDRDLIFKIAESGCNGLSFGVESGSEKVLMDMRKKINLIEIESNLKDTYETGKIQTHVNWVIGFPTENLIDYYYSNVLIFNMKKYIHYLSPGMGCGIGELSDLTQNFSKYGIAWKERPWDSVFLSSWYTVGFKNTQLNRFMRVKMFHIWLSILKSHTDSIILNSQNHDDTEQFFYFETKSKNLEEYIYQESNIDFEVLKNDSESVCFSKIIGNEFFPIFYGLYKIFRGFRIKIIFDPQKDMDSWGTMAVNYKADVDFEVNDDGIFNCSIDHTFKHIGMTSKNEEDYKWERMSLGDMSFNDNFIISGNINDWLCESSFVGETVHDVYKNKKN